MYRKRAPPASSAVFLLEDKEEKKAPRRLPVARDWLGCEWSG